MGSPLVTVSIVADMDLGSDPIPADCRELTWRWKWLWKCGWVAAQPPVLWTWANSAGGLPVILGRVTTDSRLESGGESSMGVWLKVSILGEPLREFGGVNRDPPLRTWQVGHIFTKREISSLGTLLAVSQNIAVLADLWKPRTTGAEIYSSLVGQHNAPRVYSSNLSRCLVSPSMLTLLVRPGQDFKQFLTDGNWLAFVANHFFWLAEVSRVSRENSKFLEEWSVHLAFCYHSAPVWTSS